jgi:hypothetical protein
MTRSKSAIRVIAFREQQHRIQVIAPAFAKGSNHCSRKFTPEVKQQSISRHIRCVKQLISGSICFFDASACVRSDLREDYRTLSKRVLRSGIRLDAGCHPSAVVIRHNVRRRQHTDWTRQRRVLVEDESFKALNKAWNYLWHPKEIIIREWELYHLSFVRLASGNMAS